MKTKVMQLILNALGNAKDNLYRANASFKGMTYLELAQQHGESGKSRYQILSDYKEEVEKYEQCADWLVGK